MKSIKCKNILKIVLPVFFIALLIVAIVTFKGKLSSVSQEKTLLSAINKYISSNDELNKNLENSDNSVSIPLTLLKNEGLIEFADIKVDEKNYSTELLSNPTNTCESISEIGSLSIDGRKVYLCIDESGNSSMAIIDPKKTTNMNYTTRKKYFFTGRDVRNHIKFGDKTYRILYVDTDDSIVLYNHESFGSAFSDNQLMDIYGIDTLKCNDSSYSPQYECSDFTDKSICSIKCVWSWGSSKRVEAALITYKTVKDEVIISGIDYGNSRNCYSSSSCYTFVLGPSIKSNYKIHLDSCMKITGGTGDVANPYILKDKGC